MHAIVAAKRAELSALCRRFGVVRLDVFGSAARGADFDAGTSDVDFLVEFAPAHDGLVPYLEFHDALEALLSRPVDLVDRKTIEAGRNYIRRRHILSGAEAVYAT